MLTEHAHLLATSENDTARPSSPLLPGNNRENRHFFVVGVGASVENAKALHSFLSKLDPFRGLACVLMLRGVTVEDTVLAELEAKTKLRVLRVCDGMALQAGTLYLVPQQCLTIIEGGCFHTLAEPVSRFNMPIDVCLVSLAEAMKERCMAVLFAGTGVDGIKGVKAIKEQGGVTLAQDAHSAAEAGLSSSDMLRGMCDLVLPPHLLAEELPRYLHEPTTFEAETSCVFNNESLLGQVYKILKQSCKIDFTYYKLTTIQRRIRRRMALCHIDSLSIYVNFLLENHEEVRDLTKDILIGVTSFFRNPECFEALRTKALIPLLRETSATEPLRIWVAGCSTGEEAYSVAILLDECQQELGIQREVKIFATDVDIEAIKIASRGVYTENITHDVTPERLEKYFSQRANQYIIHKSIRKKCIFSPHNLFVNPPFGQLNLITYRNVLIYFQPILQKTIFSTFHSVLKPDGFLFLGKNEYLCEHLDAFVPVATAEKVFRHNVLGRIPGTILPRTQQTLAFSSPSSASLIPPVAAEKGDLEEALPHILDTLAKACAVITDEDDVEYLSGAFEPFVQLSIGAASQKISNLLRPELTLAVASILRQARQTLTAVTNTGIALQDGSLCTITAMPLRNRKNRPMPLTAILFNPESLGNAATVTCYQPGQVALTRIEELENELRTLRNDLKYNLTELQTVNEELQTSNEEMHTANEELQTSNEELQSVNEELFTVNAEYQIKMEELTELNDDMANFLNSTLIGIMYVDMDMNIRKYTEYVSREFDVSNCDIGRSLRYFLHKFTDEHLVDKVWLVNTTLMPLQREVFTPEGKCYMLRVSPYRSANDSIKGMVLSVTDIGELKSAYTQIEKLSYALEQIPIGVTLANLDGQVEYVNPKYTEISGHRAVDVLGHPLSEHFSADLTPAIKAEIHATMQARSLWTQDMQCRKKDGDLYWERMTLMPVINRSGAVTSYLKLAEDITAGKLAQLSEGQYRQHLEGMVQARTQDLEQSRNEAQAASKAKSAFLSTVSHEIRTPMNAIMGFTHIFDRTNLTSNQQEQLDKIRLSSSTLLAVINDVLDISKIEAGKLELQCAPFSLRTALKTVQSIVTGSAETKGLLLTTGMDKNVPDWVNGDVLRLNQVLLNLLNNAIKFTPSGRVTLQVSAVSPAKDSLAQELSFTVMDTGIGISSEQIPLLFQAFTQADSSITRRFGGTGLGLAISRQLVELMGGSIWMESQLGVGSTFHFTIRLVPAQLDASILPDSHCPTDTPCPHASKKLIGLPVLVVEDNPINQEIACALLQEHGVVTSHAENGVHALKMARENRYACIFMDMQMPEMDGLEATTRLRAMGQSAERNWLSTVPIIAMTANAMAEDRARCLAVGMDDHIAKPIDPALLEKTLHYWLVSH